MDQQSKILFCWLCLQVIFTTVFADVWKAETEKEMDAWVKSCVVLPCTFNYPGDKISGSNMRGIWHKQSGKDQVIYHEDSSLIEDNFKRRTRLTGKLGDKNCSLEIDNVKDHDSGPFCFRIEIPVKDSFSFQESCVKIDMKHEPFSPQLEHPQSFTEASLALFTCSVRHTCPSHQPTLSWNRQENAQTTVTYSDIGHGVWQVQSVLNFIAAEADDHTDIICSASFHGGLTSETKHTIFVKSKPSILQIVIPVAAVAGTAILFGVVGFVVVKKYTEQIRDLRSRSTDRVWSGLSRMSRRFRSHRRNEPDRSFGAKSNNCNVSGTAGFSKPRCPSPKSDPKSYKSGGGCSDTADDDYTNMADYNVYGNM